ncbi:MAG: nickel pincer cofactor biosynthesis protein LarC2 [Nitrososphaerales archaeon]
MSAQARNQKNSTLGRSRLEFDRDVVSIVETNMDDVTGEILSRTIDRLLAEGAYDATATAHLGKKGREGFTLVAVSSNDLVEKMAEIIVEETGTLGVKVTESTRLIVPRKVMLIPFSIGSFSGNVSIKVAKVGNKILRIKPEVKEAEQISNSQKIPLREVLEQIITSARMHLEEKQP